MIETPNDTETFTVSLTTPTQGDGERPKTNWLIYLILAAIAAALLGVI